MKTITILQFILLLFLIAGCSSSPAKTKAPKTVIGIAVDGVTAQNAIITKVDGKFIYYRQKCKSCKFISEQTIGADFTEPNAEGRSYYICPKCGVTSEALIQRKTGSQKAPGIPATRVY